MYFSFSS